LNVPIIPVHLDRVWGSIFSFERKKFIWKMPRQIPYPVTVSFGKPLPPAVKSDDVRQAVLELGSRAFEHRLTNLKPLHHYFFRQAQRQWRTGAVVDTTGARLSYGRLATGPFWSLTRLRNVLPEDKNVAVLLPPGAGGVIANLALLFDGRVPVNLNYSLGRGVIDQICRDAGVTKIITARKMLEALKWGDDPRMVFLEDLPRPGKVLSAAYGVSNSFRPGGLKNCGPPLQHQNHRPGHASFHQREHGMPKGVMLTHANIHANIQGSSGNLSAHGPRHHLGVLPFFHSFGYTATLWLPLLAGCRAAYHRSPLEAVAIKKLIKEEKATVLVGHSHLPPDVDEKVCPGRRDLASIRLDRRRKTPPGLRQGFFTETLGVPILEGYGTTELSPAACVSVLSVQHATENQTGWKPGKVGRPLPGVTVKIVDPATGERLDRRVAGPCLLVKGPNVMQGYWNQPEKTGEVLKDGWYNTGDIARVDEDGFVEITDRLSRFSKIGGEMVPHMLVEQKLAELSGEPEARFLVLSTPDEKRGERLVVLDPQPPAKHRNPIGKT
jgi:acyl-[acyl-carrier-protein]-phospholipid O-acyltransferase/long-chain-fatty-acid--[acyl-carrier-protein] ligase